MTNTNIHDKIAINLINYLDSKNIKYEEDKIKCYAMYLSHETRLSYKRMETILTIGKKRRITVKEVLVICDSLGITPSVLLDI